MTLVMNCEEVDSVGVLTFLSHLAFAFAQCTHAIGMRSVGESMANE